MKSATAVIIAAAAAAAVTIVTAPATPVTAGPLPEAKAASMRTCAQRPWPYLRCVGTPFGSQKIRLVTVERLID